jgi:Glycosyltransferases involved in cell wall biogenesis
MPVFNAEKRIRVSIQSILDQTFKNFELILVDDGSVDGSPMICDEYSVIDNRVKVIHQPNKRVSEARNAGIKESKGDFISFVDADDIIDVNTYEKVMGLLSDDSIDMVIFGMRFDYYKNNVIYKSVTRSVDRSLLIDMNNFKNEFFYLYDNNYLSPVWNKVIKAAIVKENDIWFEKEMSFLEDFEFSLDILEKSKKIFVLSDPFYEYYHNLKVGSLERRPNIDCIRNFQILDMKLRNFAEGFELDEGLNARKINGMIIRYYIIAIEKIFSSSESFKYKYKEMKDIIATEEIKNALNKDYVTRGRLRVVYYLLKKRKYIILFLLFFCNDVLRK